MLKRNLVATAVSITLGVGLAKPILAQTFWTGSTINFTKPDFSDWTLEQNQDRLTDNVWITRQNNRGIFNIAQELSSNGLGTNGSSPIDTEWAFGSIVDGVETLTFNPWHFWAGGNPPGIVGQAAVLHLISEDIYIDITFTSWSIGGAAGGGGFSYERSTPTVAITVPESSSTFSLLSLGILGLSSSLVCKLKL